MAARTHTASAEANSARAARQVASVAAAAARDSGYADIGALVRARTVQGASLAAISREAGLHKDWLSRHLGSLNPEAAAIARARPDGTEARWLPATGTLGYAGVADYLRDRHGRQHHTVNQIAAEVGVSYHAVESALRRHGLTKVAHAAKRHAAGRRAAQVAAALGCASVADYVAQRRAADWTWSAMAAESGQPQTWLRRQVERGLAR
jgi:lambda repressor-like predicted transcriptional regulator